MRFSDKREGGARLAIFPARATCEVQSGDIAAVVPDRSGGSGLLSEDGVAPLVAAIKKAKKRKQ